MVAIIGVPSSAGARLGGQEEGPRALRAAGLVAALRELGVSVTDHGDTPKALFSPDPENPRARNLDLVVDVARRTAAQVQAASQAGGFPVVLGGDCSIAIGVVAALGSHPSPLGLAYFDGDLDLNTPATTPSGIFDGMVTAHLLGRGEPRLAGLGPCSPLLEPSRLAFFAYNEADGGIDPPELELLAELEALRYPLADVRRDPSGRAREARSALEERCDRILVHFDIDATRTPAVDVPHPTGLELGAALEALEVFLASPRCVGLVVTELNPRRDEGGETAMALAAGLAGALARAEKTDRPPT